MATLADLFASSQAPNVNQLPMRATPFQRPRGLKSGVGSVLDALAIMGGAAPSYRQGVDQQENAYNQSMKEQQFQNVFRNFVENPDDPAVQANLAYENPDAFLKVAPQNKILPQGGIARMGAFGAPEMVVEAPVKPVAPPRLNAGFPGLIEARARYADGSPEANLLDQRIAAEIEQKQRLAAGPAPRAAASGGAPGKPSKVLTPNQQQKVEAQNTSRTQATTLVNKLAGLYRQLEGLGAAPGSAKTTGGNVRARVMASDVGQLVGQARGTDSQAIINKIEATKALLLPFYAQALGLTSKQFDTPAEREQLLQAFGAVTGRTDANISSLGSVAEAFGGKVSDPGQGAFKVRSRRPAGGQ